MQLYCISTAFSITLLTAIITKLTFKGMIPLLYESFETVYKDIPLTVLSRNHSIGDIANDIVKLSHIHREVEVLAVLEGKAKYYIDNTEYEIKKGDIVFIAPYTIHHAVILSDFDFSHYCLCFNINIINDSELCRRLESGALTLPPIIHGENYTEYIKQIYTAHKNKCDGWQLICTGYLSLLFGELKAAGLFSEPKAITGKSDCRKIFDYIVSNYAKSISTATAAEYLHIDKSYFCRFFKKNFGCRFKDYLNIYRLEKSKQLLADSDTPISEICERVGFNSFSYYSKKFKESFSLTPSEYRNRHTAQTKL